MPEKSQKYSIEEWGNKLEQLEPGLGSEFLGKKEKSIEMLEKLDLPRYKKHIVPLKEFLDDPKAVTGDLETDRFSVVLIPVNPKLGKFAKWDINLDAAVEFARKNIPDSQIEEYKIAVHQFFPNQYGGNIVISKAGKINIEIGSQSEIAYGTATPEFTAESEDFTGSMRYSFEDEKLRAAIYRTLQSIPHEGEKRETKYNPGYYEFLLVKKDEARDLEPIFWDYKDEEAFSELKGSKNLQADEQA
jgi:hypothetical protein